MGQQGCDIVLSPAARKVYDLDIECKCVEALNVPATFFKHQQTHSKKPGLKILVHRKNRTQPLVTLLWADFLEMLKDSITLKERDKQK